MNFESLAAMMKAGANQSPMNAASAQAFIGRQTELTTKMAEASLDAFAKATDISFAWARQSLDQVRAFSNAALDPSTIAETSAELVKSASESVVAHSTALGELAGDLQKKVSSLSTSAMAPVAEGASSEFRPRKQASRA